MVARACDRATLHYASAERVGTGRLGELLGRDHATRLDAPRRTSIYGEIIPIVCSHVSTSRGHRVMGAFVSRSPKRVRHHIGGVLRAT